MRYRDWGTAAANGPKRAASRPVTPLEFPSLDDAILWMRRREDGKWTWKADASLFNVPLPDQTDPTLIARYKELQSMKRLTSSMNSPASLRSLAAVCLKTWM